MTMFNLLPIGSGVEMAYCSTCKGCRGCEGGCEGCKTTAKADGPGNGLPTP